LICWLYQNTINDITNTRPRLSLVGNSNGPSSWIIPSLLMYCLHSISLRFPVLLMYLEALPPLKSSSKFHGSISTTKPSKYFSGIEGSTVFLISMLLSPRLLSGFHPVIAFFLIFLLVNKGICVINIQGSVYSYFSIPASPYSTHT